MDEEAAEDARGVVILGDAVARVWTTSVSFVGWVHAGVGMLQRSRQSVHLRSDAPIAGIAWVHFLVVPWRLLQNELSCVIYTHERPEATRELVQKAGAE
jgi:hypothetical protein